MSLPLDPAPSCSSEPETELTFQRRQGNGEKKPSWLKVRAPGGENYTELKANLKKLDLHTVCQEARCPNIGECWQQGTATIMVLGHTCTRGCRFCAVNTGNPRGFVDPREPEHVGKQIGASGLKYVVITMVDRDDLLDGGADHVAKTVSSIKRYQPNILVETLVGDFGGRKADIRTMIDSGPDVYAHNIEVSRRMTPKIRDQRCDYDLSLEVLRYAKEYAPDRLTKSSIMVGIGETDEEVLETMQDLRNNNVDVVTLGQYLRPTQKHAALDRYVTPEQFKKFEEFGKELGFMYVASGPLVRSSYHAAEAFLTAKIRPNTNNTVASSEAQAELEAFVAQKSSAQLLPASSLLRKKP